MKLVMLSVRDRKADCFGRPFYAPTVAAGVRGFADEVARADSELAKHPEDYDLFELGEFHDSNAKFVLLDSPAQVACGDQFVKGDKS